MISKKAIEILHEYKLQQELEDRNIKLKRREGEKEILFEERFKQILMNNENKRLLERKNECCIIL